MLDIRECNTIYLFHQFAVIKKNIKRKLMINSEGVGVDCQDKGLVYKNDQF